MGANSELGATLRLDYDKATAAATGKALDIAKKKTEALIQTNEESAKAFDKAFNASRQAAKGAEAAAKAGSRSGGGGGDAPAAAKFRGAASLIGGGEIVGLVDDLQDLGEGLIQLRKNITSLPASAKSLVSAIGAGNLGMIGAIAAAAVAITIIQQQVAAQTAKTRGVIDSLTEVASIAATSTSTEIQGLIDTQEKGIKGLEASKNTANAILNGLQEEIGKMDPLSKGILNFNTAIGTGGAELKAAKAAADAANKAYNEGTIGLDGLKAAMDDASVAANDLAANEKKLAAERTKTTLDSAAAAGEEEAARRRALGASTEQNEQRLTAIEDERAAIEAQLAVLQSSGDTSEQVTDQISKLNASLGSLGKESQFIQGTALALSKERDAQKKAIDEAQKAAEEAERNQEQANQKRLDAAKNYSEALIDIATDAADAAEDALTSLQDALSQNQVDFTRDMDQLTVDADRARLESEIEAQQQEATDLREHQRNLESIRDNALNDENDALRKRDFLGAARIREAANRELEAENQAFAEQQSEREIAEGQAAEQELRELENARQDRLRALQQQNADARQAYELQLRDDEIAQDRQRRDAAIARDREIAAANELANSILQVKTAQGAAEIQIAANTLQGIANMAASFVPPQMNFAGGAGGNTTNNQSINSLGQLNMPIQTVIAPEMLQTIIMSTIDSIGLMPNN